MFKVSLESFPSDLLLYISVICFVKLKFVNVTCHDDKHGVHEKKKSEARYELLTEERSKR